MGFTQISLGAHRNPSSSLWGSHGYPWAHTATQSLFFGIHTDIPGRTQQPDLFSLGFTQISLGAHSNPISFLWDSHRYPWAHTVTRSLFSLFLFVCFLGFTQISLGAHSNPISFFFFFFLFVFWDSHRYPRAHTATQSIFFFLFLGFTQISLGAHSNPISLFFSFFGIHTDIPGRTQQPDLFSLGFTQISLGAHSNPISFLWDSHRYPWAHTATQSFFFFFFLSYFWDSHRYPWAHTATQSLFFFSFFGIHTDIPGRTQQPDLFSLGFTQISLGAHSNPISFLWDSHRYPWAHTATQSFFFFFFFFLGFTQISLGAHSNPISFLWDSHRYPWAHTATRSLFFGIHTDIPGRTQQPNLSFFFHFLGFTQIALGAHSNPISFLWDSHRYPWAHTATRSLFFGIHTDIPGRTQQPNLFFFFFFFFLGFTQISLGAHSNPISFLWDSHRFPWAHTATRALLVGIHTDIPGRTQQPKLFSLGFTQISLGSHRSPTIKRHINPNKTAKNFTCRNVTTAN